MSWVSSLFGGSKGSDPLKGSGMYTQMAKQYLPGALGGAAQQLKKSWLTPMRGGLATAQQQGTNTMAREGLGGSGIAGATNQNIYNNWAQQLAKASIAESEAKEQGYQGLGSLAGGLGLNAYQLKLQKYLKNKELQQNQDAMTLNALGSIGQGGLQGGSAAAGGGSLATILGAM